MDVGIRELKAHLSEYVERAAAGEHIRVTDRGVVKAVLAPQPAHSRIEEGLEQGWISRGTAGTARPRPRPVTPPPGRTTTEILDEDRSR